MAAPTAWLVSIVAVTLGACSGGGGERPVLVDSLEAPGDILCDGCNAVHQLGCSPGEKCTVSVFPITSSCDFSCRRDGSLPDGASCSALVDDCVAGTLCLDGACRAFCDAEAACKIGLCWPSTLEVNPFALATCSPPCEPLGPACPSGMECMLPVGPDDETPGCVTPGTGAAGAGCLASSDCASGLSCANETLATLGTATCLPRCLVAQNDCGGATTCHERTLGDGYGVCF